jgi:hypothetical protein
MELRVTLAPDGGLRLILPTGRPLDVGNTSASLRFIQRILMNAKKKKEERRGHIGEFPTQHVIEIWRREDLRLQAEANKEKFAGMGIDIAGLDITL